MIGEPIPPPIPIGSIRLSDLGVTDPGKYTLRLSLDVWSFDMEKLDEQFGSEAGQQLWNPSGFENQLFGKDQVEWSVFWERIKNKDCQISHNQIEVQDDFYLVEELPRDFPHAITSTLLDLTMRSIIMLKEVFIRWWADDWTFCYIIEISEPLPAPLAGRLELWSTDRKRPIGYHNLVYHQGFSVPNQSVCGSMSTLKVWNDLISIESLVEGIPKGDSLPIRLRFVPNSDLASRISGMNGYWNGKFSTNLFVVIE